MTARRQRPILLELARDHRANVLRTGTPGPGPKPRQGEAVNGVLPRLFFEKLPRNGCRTSKHCETGINTRHVVFQFSEENPIWAGPRTTYSPSTVVVLVDGTSHS